MDYTHFSCFLALITFIVDSYKNIKVVENHSKYKVSKISFLVYLVKTTSVKEDEHPEIPLNVHVITRFTDIIVGVAPRDTLVDKYSLSVKNIKHGSKLDVNTDIAEIREFHNRCRYAILCWQTIRSRKCLSITI
ncbi:hypothetical protein HKD37_02G004226 [Glycine soja]